jgi:hypothetical protein
MRNPASSAFRKGYLLRCLLVVVWALGCSQSKGDGERPRGQTEVAAPRPPEPPVVEAVSGPGSVTELVHRIANMETLSRPDPQAVARLAGGGDVLPTDSATSFEVKTPLDGVSVWVDGGAFPQVRLRTDLRKGLMLRELSAELGEPKILMESKTSSVVFELERKSRHVSVYVQLFTPRVAESSPVLAIAIRQRDAASNMAP